MLNYLDINKYTINLEVDKKLFYKLTYSIEPIELEALKIFIKINLSNDFIYLFTSSTKAYILFIKKFNKNFYLYINYQDLNNVIIKDLNLLLLINKLLNQLNCNK